MFNFLNTISRNRTPWFLLAATALSLELAALFFQYELLLEPCVLCVYERTAIMGILLAGIVGSIAPYLAAIRWFGILLWAASAGWGLQLAMKHTGIQLFPSPSNSCDFMANYPTWFPLDRWFPSMFEPTGFCDEIQWQFFGYTMPQTMMGVYAIYLTVLVAVILSQFIGERNP